LAVQSPVRKLIAVAFASVLLLALATTLPNFSSFPSNKTTGSDRPFSSGTIPLQATPVPRQPTAPIIVNWTTKSEINTAGFNLFRGEGAIGPFTQINRALIPASYDPVTGGSYVFTDTNVVAGVTYYYQLEEVEVNGLRTRYDRLITATARPLSDGLLGVPTSTLFVAAGAMLLIGLGAIVWTFRRK